MRGFSKLYKEQLEDHGRALEELAAGEKLLKKAHETLISSSDSSQGVKDMVEARETLFRAISNLGIPDEMREGELQRQFFPAPFVNGTDRQPQQPEQAPQKLRYYSRRCVPTCSNC